MTWENDERELRRLDGQSGEVHEQLRLPDGVGVSGLESAVGDRSSWADRRFVVGPSRQRISGQPLLSDLPRAHPSSAWLLPGVEFARQVSRH